jgi:glutathione synthase/RimK-type ligase-like ATP-grasp enzyme
LTESQVRSLVLVLADADDVGVRKLVAWLESRCTVIWWRFGLPETSVDARLTGQRFRLEQPGAVLTSELFREAQIVIYKRRWLQPKPLVPSQLVNTADRVFSEREWGSLLEGILLAEERSGQATWVNAPSVWAVTHNKLSLLLEAGRHGARIPPFEITTSIERGALSGDVVIKAISADEMIDDGRYFSTTRLRDRDLAGVVGEKLSTPSLFQEYLSVDHELRVYYILGHWVTVVLRPSPQHVDIRHVPADAMEPRLGELPAGLRRVLAGIVARHGLNYCAFDILVPSDGQPWLVDITPAGSWDYFENGGPAFISEELARAVLEYICADRGRAIT